jgi:hypothetical protein
LSLRYGNAQRRFARTGILARLGTSADAWAHPIESLFSRSRLLGSYLATDRSHLSKAQG